MYANKELTTATAETTTASKPTPPNQPVHPALKSLWNIPHLLPFPDPFPPIDDIRALIQNRIVELTAQRDALPPSSPRFFETKLGYNSDIAVLENKLEELKKHFPPQQPQAPAQLPASPSTPTAPTAPEPPRTVVEIIQTTATNSNPAAAPSTVSLNTESGAINPPRSELTLPNQHTPGELKVSFGELEVSSGEAKVSFAESAPSSAESQLTSTELQPDPAQTQTPAPASVQPYLQSAALEPFVDIGRHLSGRSPLDRLFQQQQEAIILLLGDHSAERVAQIIAQPPPLGFALKTTDASIIRFRSRFTAAKCAAARQNDEQALADLLAEAHQSDAGFQNVIQRLIKDRLVRAAGQQHFSLGVLDSLLTSLIKFRKQSLAERKQTHAENQ